MNVQLKFDATALAEPNERNSTVSNPPLLAEFCQRHQAIPIGDAVGNITILTESESRGLLRNRISNMMKIRISACRG